MIHLIYVSTATREMSKEDLLFLLEQSRNRNKRQNITGMLLYGGGCFFQVLEGEASDVEEIYAAIVDDERNTDNILIEKEAIEERIFPDWSMAFKQLTRKDKASIKGYSEFLDREMKPEEFTNMADEVIDLFYEFKKHI